MADLLLALALVVFVVAIVCWCARDFLATRRESRPTRRPPITARMQASRPCKIEPYSTRYARNVGWLRRHPGQP